MRKLVFLFVLVLSVSVLLAACGDNDEEFTILTGGEQGAYYPLGAVLATLVNDHVEGATATHVSSGASVINVNSIDMNDGEIALVQNDIAYFAVEGDNDIFEESIDSFSGVATLYPEVVHIITAADSDIETVEDLHGMRVAVGDQGSGTETNARQILDAHGITYDDINVEYLDFGNAADSIQDGNIDAAFIVGGVPIGAIEALKAQKDIRLVSLSEDVIDDLADQFPYFVPHTVDADDYGTEEGAETVAVRAMVIVSNNLDEDTVYELTAAMLDNAESFGNAHQSGRHISLETAQDGMSVDLHPGAQRYFDEQ